jgi:hypothetical protein
MVLELTGPSKAKEAMFNEKKIKEGSENKQAGNEAAGNGDIRADGKRKRGAL